MEPAHQAKKEEMLERLARLRDGNPNKTIKARKKTLYDAVDVELEKAAMIDPKIRDAYRLKITALGLNAAAEFGEL